MIGALVALVVVASLALATWAVVFVVRDRAVVLRQLWAAAVVEALLLVQGVVQAVVLVRTGHAVSVPLFFGYVAAGLVLLPLAAAWAFAERTRWSSVVLAAAALVVAFLQLRLVQVWAG
ncbi:MAG: hypothetical protein KJ792_05885 [Actinobacteria bacterium]|nr:hypothetical protein [Actinomycetota bacterium]MCG2801505.1 hypothetical protein [Cellulomonas sp.]